MIIDLPNFRGETYNFLIMINNKCYMTSKSIADLFNLNVDTYNNILIKEVIKHSHYKNSCVVNFIVFGVKSDKDIVFYMISR